MILRWLVAAAVIGGLMVAGVWRAVECCDTYALDGPGACVLPVLLKEDTEYASGFSHARFRQVKIGMTVEEVVRLLGQPLEKRVFETRKEWWSWSRSPRSHSYRVRGVLLETGQVTKVVHEFYVD